MAGVRRCERAWPLLALANQDYDLAFTLQKKLLELGEKSPELYYNAG